MNAPLHNSAKDRLPKVTVMIPTYCQAPVILRAVDSALAQDYENIAVVVADDCSPDETRDLVATRTDPRLRYHRNSSNLGRVANYRNALTTLASGDWVVNLDGDDYYVDNGFVRAAIELAMTDENILLVVARRETHVGKERHAISCVPEWQVMSGLSVVASLPDSRYFFSHMTTLYRRDAALRTGFYLRERISSDWESLYRLALHGKVAFLDRIAGVWNVGPDSISQVAGDSQRLANLDIWESIAGEAILLGGDPDIFCNMAARCRQHFARVSFADVLRTQGTCAACRYLKALLHHSPRELLGVLVDIHTYSRLGRHLVLQGLRPLRAKLSARV